MVRVLVVAEAFGFGPAVAAAQLASALSGKVRLAYAGSGHTLDVQPRGVYEEVHHLETTAELARVLPQYDAVLVSMDWEAARVARRAGKPVAFYDALTWYWDTEPDGAEDVGLYLAQDFPGVQERVTAWELENAHVVPPLCGTVPEQRRSLEGRSGWYVSLGGIANPHWDETTTLTYAACMDAAVRDLPGVTVSSSRKVCERLGTHAKTLSWEESRGRFHQAERSVVTPGLGNLYDAASADVPTLLLPPANDSQGRQLRALVERGWCDRAVEWHDLLPVRPIEYQGPQAEVMAQLGALVRALAVDERAQARLAEAVRDLAPGTRSRIGELARTHGGDGASVAARHVQAWVEGLPQAS